MSERRIGNGRDIGQQYYGMLDGYTGGKSGYINYSERKELLIVGFKTPEINKLARLRGKAPQISSKFEKDKIEEGNRQTFQRWRFEHGRLTEWPEPEK